MPLFANILRTAAAAITNRRTYDFQLQQKQAILRETLQRLGGIAYEDEIAMVAGDPWNYRNRIQLHFGKRSRRISQSRIPRSLRHHALPYFLTAFERCHCEVRLGSEAARVAALSTISRDFYERERRAIDCGRFGPALLRRGSSPGAARFSRDSPLVRSSTRRPDTPFGSAAAPSSRSTAI